MLIIYDYLMNFFLIIFLKNFIHKIKLFALYQNPIFHFIINCVIMLLVKEMIDQENFKDNIFLILLSLLNVFLQIVIVASNVFRNL